MSNTTSNTATGKARAAGSANPHAIAGIVWVPRIDPQPVFNPFANIETAARSPGAMNVFESVSPTAIREPTIDTAPLQGMKDLSDEDSLTDVIAANTDGEPAR